MKTLIGGAAAAVLGLIGLSHWWDQFMTIIAGALPVTLLLGGALAIYLGFDELKDNWQKEESLDMGGPADDVDRYKKELDDLKKEIDSLKK
ncbi:MAG: hypothetical protein HZB23_01115 [Deltaproteobacteria bacterium]|nr:hypothetical protein [Deltaproteobacteria bacterium]